MSQKKMCFFCPTNSLIEVGSRKCLKSTETMKFITFISFSFYYSNWLSDWLLQTFFRAKDAVWPPRTSLTGILLRWMDLTAMGMKVPSGSGPKSSVSLSRIIPRNVVPETTVPTPCQRKGQQWVSRVYFPFFPLFIVVICRQSLTVWSLQAYSSLRIIFVQWGFPTWKNKYKQFQFWHFAPYHEFSHPQSSYFQKVVLSIFTTMSTAFIQAAFKEKLSFSF